jgi:hypothetical protein
LAGKKGRKSTQQKSQGTKESSSAHRLSRRIRSLLCLLFGFGNSVFVLLLVLCHLSLGLIGRDILRFG